MRPATRRLPRRRRGLLIVGAMALSAAIVGGVMTGLALDHGGPAATTPTAGPSPYQRIAGSCRAVSGAALSAVGVPAGVTPIVRDSGPHDGLTTDNCSWSTSGSAMARLEVFVDLLQGTNAVAQAGSIEQTDIRSYEQEREFTRVTTQPVHGLGDRAVLLVDRATAQSPSADGYLFIRSRNAVIQVLLQRGAPQGDAGSLPSSAALRGWDTGIGRQVLNALASA